MLDGPKKLSASISTPLSKTLAHEVASSRQPRLAEASTVLLAGVVAVVEDLMLTIVVAVGVAG